MIRAGRGGNRDAGGWRMNIAEFDSDLQYGRHHVAVLKNFEHENGSGIKKAMMK